MIRFSTMKKRAEFLATARGAKAVTPSMIVQARSRQDGAASCRVGFTCSKKVGNAVVRNRAKRRLRAAAMDVIPAHGRSGWDYVLIGRADRTVALGFEKLVADLSAALERCHKGARNASDSHHASDIQ